MRVLLIFLLLMSLSLFAATGTKYYHEGLIAQSCRIDILNEDGSKGVCSGTIVGERKVLTGAHCFPKPPKKIEIICPNEVRTAITYHIHPDYIWSDNEVDKRNADHAMLIVDTSFKTAPVEIPKNIEQVRELLKNPEKCFQTGYGRKEILGVEGLGTIKHDSVPLELLDDQYEAYNFFDLDDSALKSGILTGPNSVLNPGDSGGGTYCKKDGVVYRIATARENLITYSFSTFLTYESEWLNFELGKVENQAFDQLLEFLCDNYHKCKDFKEVKELIHHSTDIVNKLYEKMSFDKSSKRMALIKHMILLHELQNFCNKESKPDKQPIFTLPGMSPVEMKDTEIDASKIDMSKFSDNNKPSPPQIDVGAVYVFNPNKHKDNQYEFCIGKPVKCYTIDKRRRDVAIRVQKVMQDDGRTVIKGELYIPCSKLFPKQKCGRFQDGHMVYDSSVLVNRSSIKFMNQIL